MRLGFQAIQVEDYRSCFSQASSRASEDATGAIFCKFNGTLELKSYEPVDVSKGAAL